MSVQAELERLSRHVEKKQGKASKSEKDYVRKLMLARKLKGDSDLQTQQDGSTGSIWDIPTQIFNATANFIAPDPGLSALPYPPRNPYPKQSQRRSVNVDGTDIADEYGRHTKQRQKGRQDEDYDVIEAGKGSWVDSKKSSSPSRSSSEGELSSDDSDVQEVLSISLLSLY